jgi:hypothetical protein
MSSDGHCYGVGFSLLKFDGQDPPRDLEVYVRMNKTRNYPRTREGMDGGFNYICYCYYCTEMIPIPIISIDDIPQTKLYVPKAFFAFFAS